MTVLAGKLRPRVSLTWAMDDETENELELDVPRVQRCTLRNLSLDDPADAGVLMRVLLYCFEELILDGCEISTAALQKCSVDMNFMPRVYVRLTKVTVLAAPARVRNLEVAMNAWTQLFAGFVERLIVKDAPDEDDGGFEPENFCPNPKPQSLVWSYPADFTLHKGQGFFHRRRCYTREFEVDLGVGESIARAVLDAACRSMAGVADLRVKVQSGACSELAMLLYTNAAVLSTVDIELGILVPIPNQKRHAAEAAENMVWDGLTKCSAVSSVRVEFALLDMVQRHVLDLHRWSRRQQKRSVFRVKPRSYGSSRLFHDLALSAKALAPSANVSLVFDGETDQISPWEEIVRAAWMVPTLQIRLPRSPNTTLAQKMDAIGKIRRVLGLAERVPSFVKEDGDDVVARELVRAVIHSYEDE